MAHGIQHKRIFLSAVTREFGSYRPEMGRRLNRPNVDVKDQEHFSGSGGTTLEKLDDYIRHCDAVIQLIGDATGASPTAADVKQIMDRYPDMLSKLPQLAEALQKEKKGVSYTQWEAYLAIYHGRKFFIYHATPKAPRSQDYVPNEDETAAQSRHFDRMCQLGRDRTEFEDLKDLIASILRDLLDILAQPPPKQSVWSKILSPIQSVWARLDKRMFEVYRAIQPIDQRSVVPRAGTQFWYAAAFRGFAVIQAAYIFWIWYFQVESGSLHGMQQTVFLYLAAVLGLIILGSYQIPRRLTQLARLVKANAWKSRHHELISKCVDFTLSPIELTCSLAAVPAATELWMKPTISTEWISSLAVFGAWEVILAGAQIIRYWPIYRRWCRGLFRRSPPAITLAINWLVGGWFLFNPQLLPTGADNYFRAKGEIVTHLAADDNSQEIAVGSFGQFVSEQFSPATTIEIISTPSMENEFVSLDRVPWEGKNLRALAFINRQMIAECEQGDMSQLDNTFSVWDRQSVWKKMDVVPPRYENMADMSLRLDEWGRVLSWGSERITGSGVNGTNKGADAMQTFRPVVGWSKGPNESFVFVDPEHLQGLIQISVVALSKDEKTMAVVAIREPSDPTPRGEDPLTVNPYIDAMSSELLLLIDLARNSTVCSVELGSLFWFSNPTAGLAFSPDGMRVLVSNGGATHTLFDTSNGHVTLRIDTDAGEMQWSSDNLRLALRREQRLEIYDALNGDHLKTFCVPRGRYTCHAFSSDSKQILAGGDQGIVWAYPVPKSR